MKKIDISALKELNKELYDALKTYCPCNIVKGTDKKAFCIKCKDRQRLKKSEGLKGCEMKKIDRAIGEILDTVKGVAMLFCLVVAVIVFTFLAFYMAFWILGWILK